MRFLAIFLVLGVGFGQESRSINVFTYDANGRRIPVGGTTVAGGAGATSQTETTQSVNGRAVPLTATKEKILVETPSGRTVERIITTNDATGRPVRTERMLIEEQKRADGGLNVTTSTFRSEVNGRMELAERSTMTSSKSGEGTSSETVTERKTINGGFGTVERRATVVKASDRVIEAESTVYRPDMNGAMRAQEREVVKTEKTASGTRVETTTYNEKSSKQAGNGLEFATQSVSETVVGADGSQSTVTDVYAQSAPGRATSGTKPQLKERLVVERRAVNGGYVEALSVQRPEVADGRLGKPQAVSETVCMGKCAEAPKK
jgi:hypothetical protein